MKKHLKSECPKRNIQCTYCDQIIIASNEPIHFSTCGNFPISCPNECTKNKFARKMLDHHLETECNRQDIVCPFAKCNFKSTKKHMDLHLNENIFEHLNLLNLNVCKLAMQTESNVNSLILILNFIYFCTDNT